MGLFQWGYIEELGLGIDRMIEVMEQAGHQPPNFDARPYSFAVTLFNEREKPKPPEWMRNTNHRQAKALQYIRENGSITNREYRQLCDGVSAETLRLDLVDMGRKRHFIESRVEKRHVLYSQITPDYLNVFVKHHYHCIIDCGICTSWI